MAGGLSTSSGKNQKQKENLIITSWNIQTLLDNENADHPERHTLLVAHVLKGYNMDIAALQESRLTGKGTLQEEEGGYTFFWSGRPEEE